MKSKAQLVDLIAAVSRTIRWTMIALQEAAMETESPSILYTATGHVIYINKAEAHARSTALVVHKDWINYVQKVHFGSHFQYVDFAFRTERTDIRNMRAGSAHLLPESEHHSVEEYIQILEDWEKNTLGIGRRHIQMWGIDANVELDAKFTNEAICTRVRAEAVGESRVGERRAELAATLASAH